MMRTNFLTRAKTSLLSCSCVRHESQSPQNFKPKKALILTKVSRYEYERLRHPNLSETEFELALNKRGSDYAMIRFHHNVHKSSEERVIRSLESHGIETRKVQRYDYAAEDSDWADMIVTAGGDGTFLLGAAKIRAQNKPIIGVNTDPTRSEGHLCLPKHFSFNIESAFDKIMKGDFSWYFRRRLRVTLVGDHAKIHEPPVELHTQQLLFPEYRYMDFLSEKSVRACDHPLVQHSVPQKNGTGGLATRRLPVLALNDVFVGESLSSRVSYLEVKFENDNYFKTRNSGLCISTGTGSTSWTFNINKLNRHSVEALLKIVRELTHLPISPDDNRLVESITQRFNQDLVFDPELNLMAYSLRDPVSVGMMPDAGERKPKGKVKKIEVKSRCFDACLVIDGSLSFKFNDGTKAIIEIHDEDALRTILIR